MALTAGTSRSALRETPASAVLNLSDPKEKGPVGLEVKRPSRDQLITERGRADKLRQVRLIHSGHHVGAGAIAETGCATACSKGNDTSMRGADHRGTPFGCGLTDGA